MGFMVLMKMGVKDTGMNEITERKHVSKGDWDAGKNIIT